MSSTCLLHLNCHTTWQACSSQEVHYSYTLEIFPIEEDSIFSCQLYSHPCVLVEHIPLSVCIVYLLSSIPRHKTSTELFVICLYSPRTIKANEQHHVYIASSSRLVLIIVLTKTLRAVLGLEKKPFCNVFNIALWWWGWWGWWWWWWCVCVCVCVTVCVCVHACGAGMLQRE